jgi:hypothetical protein
MIRYHSQKQLSLAEFDWPFQTALDENNRWVKLSECIPWDELAEGYYRGPADSQGRPTKDARLVIGAVIIKHKLCLSDWETVAQIQENPYLQYFVGLPGYQMQAPFVPSLFIEVRKRMGVNQSSMSLRRPSLIRWKARRPGRRSRLAKSRTRVTRVMATHRQYLAVDHPKKRRNIKASSSWTPR